MNRLHFLKLMAQAAAGLAVTPLLTRPAHAAAEYDFWFTRLMYDSGDWDVDQRMPANIITSLIDYTTLAGRSQGTCHRAVGSEHAAGAVLLSGRPQAGASSTPPNAAISKPTCATAASCSWMTATTTSTACSPNRSRPRWPPSSAPGAAETAQQPSRCTAASSSSTARPPPASNSTAGATIWSMII